MTEDEAKNKGLLEEGGAAPEGDVTYVEDKGDSASVTESGRLSSGTTPVAPEPEAAPDPSKPAPVQPPAVPVAPLPPVGSEDAPAEPATEEPKTGPAPEPGNN